MKTRVSFWLFSVAALAAVLVAACGGDDDATTSPETGDEPTAAATVPASPDHGHTADSAVMTASAVAFQADMRKLWEDHVTWTRLFIVSAVADLPDKAATTERLLQNQSDIGDAIKPFYGDAGGDALTALLEEHILVAADLVGAAKAGDSEAVAAANTNWYRNADDIATFLSTANPENWPLADATAMMREHLDETLVEATTQLTGDYAGSVAAYDRIHVQILEMADMLSSGIIAQFPDHFE